MKKKWTELKPSYFCEKTRAGIKFLKHITKSGAKTMGDVWRLADLSSSSRVWIATRSGVMDRETIIRFACFCTRQYRAIIHGGRTDDQPELESDYDNYKDYCFPYMVSTQVYDAAKSNEQAQQVMDEQAKWLIENIKF